MSAIEGLTVAELTVKALKSMRTDVNFNAFFSLCNCFCELTKSNLPTLPRRRKAPRQFEIGTEEGSHSGTVDDHYTVKHSLRYCMDLAIASISDQLNQPGYAIYSNLENLLVNAANGEPFNDLFTFDSMEMILIHHNYLHIVPEFWDIFQGMLKTVHECLVALQNMSFSFQ